MASPQQILVNTQNGRLGAGHKSEEGKAASAKNATKHGLTSKDVVLANESEADFEALHQQYIRLYAPANPEQIFLIQQLAESDWRLRRARRLETKFFNQHSEEEILNDKEVSAALARLTRYEGAIERSYYKALRQAKLEMKAGNARNLAILEAYITSPLPFTKRSETPAMSDRVLSSRPPDMGAESNIPFPSSEKPTGACSPFPARTRPTGSRA